jgi:hypothetical protein
MKRALGFIAVIALSACSLSPFVPYAPPDTGLSSNDAAPADLGTDAGFLDAGEHDSGLLDAGGEDALIEDAPLPDAAALPDAELLDAELLDAEPIDALPSDASNPDAVAPDAAPGDALPGDALPNDSMSNDAAAPDAAPRDAAAPDAAALDAAAPDAAAPDAAARDAAAPDATPIDTGFVDAGFVDAGFLDAAAPDATPPDAGFADASPPDTGPRDAGFVTVTVAISGMGRVSSPQAPLACAPASCTGSFVPNQTASFQPVPNAGWGFELFGGAPGCTGPSCSFIVQGPTNLSASFDQNLVAYLPMEGNGADASGNDNEATQTVGTVTRVTGVVRDALSFAPPSYLSIPDATGLDGGSALTFCSWIRPTTPSGAQQTAIEKAGVYALQIGQQGAFRTAQVSFVSGGTTYTASANNLANDTWVHLCGRFRTGLLGAQVVWIFVNGAVASSATALVNLNALPNNGAAVTVAGCSACSAAQSLAGAVDELKIWNRFLTDQEIADEANRR